MIATPNSNAGKQLPCSRCAKPCIIAATRNDAARIGRNANGPGICGDCHITSFIKDLIGQGDKPDPHAAGWFPAFTVDGLRLPHIQETIVRVLLAGHADLKAEAIDWDEIIANWDLPTGGPSRKSKGLFQ